MENQEGCPKVAYNPYTSMNNVDLDADHMDDDGATSAYTRFDKPPKRDYKHELRLTKRWLVPCATVAAVVIACIAFAWLAALSVKLNRAYSIIDVLQGNTDIDNNIQAATNNTHDTTRKENVTPDFFQAELQNSSVEYSVCLKLFPLATDQLHMTSLLLERFDDITNNTPAFSPSMSYAQSRHHFPRDCSEVQAAGFNTSGRYAIHPEDAEDPFFVFCDMDTAGGGWTVFQRRENGHVNFFLNWLDYKYGFGSVESEHWLGNDKLHRLTSQKTYKLRADLQDFEGETRYAEYDEFLVASENMSYQLTLGNYQGSAGDSLGSGSGQPISGDRFTTRDRDQDSNRRGNCAELYKGGWWYHRCHGANPNGLYLHGAGAPLAEAVVWKKWHGFSYSLKRTELKLRPFPTDDSETV